MGQHLRDIREGMGFGDFLSRGNLSTQNHSNTYSVCDDIVEEQGRRRAHGYKGCSSIAGIAHATGAGWERFPEHCWGSGCVSSGGRSL